MDVRLEKARAIVRTLKLRQRGNTWLVPSQSGHGKGYVVTHEGEHFRCDCPDFEHRHTAPGSGYCKHILAVAIVLTQTEETTRTEETRPDGTRTVTTKTTVVKTARVTYRQDWPAYNKAQTEEKATFQTLLHDLCAGIPQPEQAGRNSGRKRLRLGDMIFAAAFKVYSTFSGRRFMTDLREAHAKGYIAKVPHFNSIFNYLEAEELTPLLQELVTISSLPLAAIETTFAADSSGFSSCRYVRWFDAKHGDGPQAVALMEQHDWKKCHIICGVKTNVVTGVEVTDRNANDSPFLPLLVGNTARHFQMEEVSADKQYSSKNNLKHIVNAGATPFVPFKSNATGGLGPMTLWKRMFHYYSYQREEFLARYHQRSNVESTFGMIKAKFGEALRSKTERAQLNELLLKVLCHNICCIIQSMHELGISPEFASVRAA